ncbi:MAG: Na(+)-translocating NADH-quinone reductase subunit C, partial [Lutibacter sp.]
MAKNTESNTYTVLFAIGMVLIVGTLLAFVATSLEGKISENKRIEKQQNILYAMGVNENDETSVEFVSKSIVAKEFAKYITKQLVITGTEAVEDPNAYLIDIKKEATEAKNPNYKRKLPLFIGEKDGKTLYIVPVRGKGLWDAIWGYVAIDNQLIVQG